MSSSETSDQRGADADELADHATAGERGIPVDAVCTGCAEPEKGRRRVRVKRVPREDLDVEDLEDAHRRGSFEHICHNCGTVTWWNVISVLWGVLRSEADDEDQEESS